jgi:hypothetical protein
VEQAAEAVQGVAEPVEQAAEAVQGVAEPVEQGVAEPVEQAVLLDTLRLHKQSIHPGKL